MIPDKNLSVSKAKRMFRNMTPRQLQRRTKMPVGTARNSDSRQSVIKIGGRSRVVRTKEKLLIEIFQEDMGKVDFSTVEKFFVLSNSPILEDGNKKYGELYELKPARRKMLHFALFMNNIGHYSGGRYYLVQIAVMLAEMGHKVTVVTDHLPFFMKDFRYHDYEDNLEFVAEERCRKTKWMLQAIENSFNFIIESPLVRAGFMYARKWSLPLYACLFESPNYVSEYRQGNDSTEEYWAPYKNGIIRDANSVLCLSDHAMLKAKEWLDKQYNGLFHKVAPCINTRIADRVQCDVVKNEIVFVGRHVGFKNPNDIILAVSRIPEKNRPVINYIGSHSGSLREQMVTYALSVNVTVKFFANITDEEKFYLIKRSKMMVFPSVFEGFGMGPAEALYCKKPVVAYDIPVLRGEYGDAIQYVDMNNITKLSKAIMDILDDKKESRKIGEKGFKAFYRDSKPIPCLPSTMKRSLRNTFYGGSDLTITAGMIAVNASDTILTALLSIYDFVDKIVIVEGAVEDYARVNPQYISGVGSCDDTVELIRNFPDPFGKIELVQNSRLYKNKNEMQNEIAERIETDLYLKVDADEIFIESDVEYMKRNFMMDKQLCILSILKHEFWKDLNTVATGGIWDRPQPRMWRWDKHWRHPEDVKTGFNFYVDKKGNKVAPPDYKAMMLMEKLCYHLGYVGKDDRINSKIRYYAGRGIETNVKNVYADWKPGDATNSTNPNGTTAAPFAGTLPKILQKWYIKQIKIDDVKESLENNINMMSSPPKRK